MLPVVILCVAALVAGACVAALGPPAPSTRELLVSVVLAALVIGALAYLVHGHGPPPRIDRWAARWAHAHATHRSKDVLLRVSWFGAWPAVPVIALAVWGVVWVRRSSLLAIPFLIVVWLGDERIDAAIKQAVGRARPALDPISIGLGPAFPSGHSATAASFYAAVALIAGRGCSSRTRARLTGAAVAIAVAIASSRVLLDVHWLTDVIAGLALGWGWFGLCVVAFGVLERRHGRLAAARIRTR